MKKLISLVLTAGLLFIGHGSALAAFQSLETETVTASVDVTGTPYVDVTPQTITWRAITLGVDNWVAANEALQVTYLLPANGGVQIYTTNSNGKPGLIGGTNPSTVLPTSWRATNESPTAAQKLIYEKLVNERDAETTTGIEQLNGEAGIQANVVYDVNGNGQIGQAADNPYISLLSDNANAYLEWDATNSRVAYYACYLWMKNKPPLSNYEDYATIVKPEGMQHAENTWGAWASSPIYLTIGANFGNATPQLYNLNLTIELYSL